MSLGTTSTSSGTSFKKEVLFWQDRGDEKILLLPKNLGEDFRFPDERPRLSQILVIDCRYVQHVSSGWASQFITWHRRLPIEQQYIFRNCPRKFVDMINFVVGFLPPHASVESFEAPFECTSCGHESSETMSRGKHYLESRGAQEAILRIPLELNCDKCPGMMEFSVLENIYLRFLNSKHES